MVDKDVFHDPAPVSMFPPQHGTDVNLSGHLIDGLDGVYSAGDASLQCHGSWIRLLS